MESSVGDEADREARDADERDEDDGGMCRASGSAPVGHGPVPVKADAARPPLRHVRLGHALDEGLRAECRRTGAPASEVLRRALSSYLG